MPTPVITKHWGTHVEGPWQVDLYAYDHRTPNLGGLVMLTDRRTMAHYYLDLDPSWGAFFADLPMELPKVATTVIKRASRKLTGCPIIEYTREL